MILPQSRQSNCGSDGDGASLAGAGPLGRRSEEGWALRILDEFARAWERGERPAAEEFLRRHPGLSMQPEAAIRLIYEEVCLRQSAGQDVTIGELVRRFPQWQTELEVLLDCDQLLGAIARPAVLPTVGETLGDFVLLAELGRGARGRCFLAAQPSLSYRQVVVKVTPDDHVEHLSLARMQHTHIMPLYSEHEFPSRRVRALCMPYLGGATLARVQSELMEIPVELRQGKALLEILDRAQEASPWPQSGESPARRFLAQTSYVHATCWIGACLADALQYAHDRGLVHMDLKPSNILLTADAQPMLLDFHLAREPIPAGELPSDGVGGTPGYMSPEQERRVSALESPARALPAVDSRTDLYSLGRVLAEMLGLGDRPGAALSHSRRPVVDVSTGLADIVRKCLATLPADRYQGAAALADDLRRHMADQPLRGVPNRSLSERLSKWRRSRPYEFFRVKILSIAVLAVVTVGALVWATFLAPRFRAAALALSEGRALLERHDYPQAARALTRGAAFVEGLPGTQRLSQELAAALRLTDRMEGIDSLHRLVDRLRFAESAALAPAPALDLVERNCRVLWQSRRSLLEGPGQPLLPAVEERLRDDLLDLAIIGSSLRVRLEREPQEAAEARRAALLMLEEAEALFGPSHVLYRARQAHAAALGLSSMAAVAALDASRVPPRTAWEHDAAGRVWLAAGDLDRAWDAFEHALIQKPQDLWPNFHQGMCAFRLGRYQDAESAFRVCIALAPDRAECFYNHALALAALGRTALAARSYDRAVALDPALAAVPLDRSIPRRSAAADRRVAP
jgi:eukaryotic-like serine/threonine-protein kinase